MLLRTKGPQGSAAPTYGPAAKLLLRELCRDGVLYAAAALLGPDVAQALGAADAGRILALLQVLHKVRLADEGAGGGDKLDACVQDGLDRLRPAHAADQDEGDLDLLADGLGLVQVEGGYLLLAQAQPVVAGQLNGVGTQGLELTAEVEDVLGVGGLVLAAAVGVDLDEDGVVLADCFTDGGETFAGEAEAVLWRCRRMHRCAGWCWGPGTG